MFQLRKSDFGRKTGKWTHIKLGSKQESSSTHWWNTMRDKRDKILNTSQTRGRQYGHTVSFDDEVNIYQTASFSLPRRTKWLTLALPLDQYLPPYIACCSAMFMVISGGGKFTCHNSLMAVHMSERCTAAEPLQRGQSLNPNGPPVMWLRSTLEHSLQQTGDGNDYQEVNLCKAEAEWQSERSELVHISGH